MTTKATVTSIVTNLESILTGLSLNLEDQSGDGLDVTPAGAVEYLGEDFDDNSQQGPVYNTSNFLIKVRAKRVGPATDRDTQVTWVHDLKDALTVSALNIGDLALSKLVTRVNHDGASTSTEGEFVKIDYDIGVKYRVT